MGTTNALPGQIAALQAIIDTSRRIVFFGGAGVSTESGIPDFRSANGLFRNGTILSPEQALSVETLATEPEQFFAFYRRYLVYPDAQPNKAHRALAALEQAGRLIGVITQNIDGLHQAAGSREVVELHGSLHRNRCSRCGLQYGAGRVIETEGVPHCACGGMIRPDIVLYGESLEPFTLRKARRMVMDAEVLIVGGTSLVVHPAAGLLQYFEGRHLVLINRDPTPHDNAAQLIIREPIGEVLGALQI